jgi:hypothetical protein
MILNRDYSGVVDVVVDGKTVTRSYTLKKGDIVPTELGEYLLRDLPHYLETKSGEDRAEKSTVSPNVKIINKSPNRKG